LEQPVLSSPRVNLDQIFQPFISEFALDVEQQEADLIAGPEQPNFPFSWIACEQFQEAVVFSAIQIWIEGANEKDELPCLGFEDMNGSPYLMQFFSSHFMKVIVCTMLIIVFILSWFITKDRKKP